MRLAATVQMDAYEEAEKAGVEWMKERERGRGRLSTVLRAWREVVEHSGLTLRLEPERWRVRRLTQDERTAMERRAAGGPHHAAGAPRRATAAAAAAAGAGDDAMAANRQCARGATSRESADKFDGRRSNLPRNACSKAPKFELPKLCAGVEGVKEELTETLVGRVRLVLTYLRVHTQEYRQERAERRRKEARDWTRKEEDATSRQTRKSVRWQRAKGAEVGMAMLWRIEGKMPMVRPRPKRTDGDG